MPKVEDLVAAMRINPKGIRFTEACKVCEHFFGPPRQRGSSHRLYRMPWPGDPRVNVQNDRGMAKAYQIRQIIKAIEKLTSHENPRK
jgi:hypothetical protein